CGKQSYYLISISIAARGVMVPTGLIKVSLLQLLFTPFRVTSYLPLFNPSCLLVSTRCILFLGCNYSIPS
ncbi:MAG: hypothetical protein ACERKN_02100, partial [Velocimicrobium sp.]